MGMTIDSENIDFTVSLSKYTSIPSLERIPRTSRTPKLKPEGVKLAHKVKVLK